MSIMKLALQVLGVLLTKIQQKLYFQFTGTLKCLKQHSLVLFITFYVLWKKQEIVCSHQQF